MNLTLKPIKYLVVFTGPFLKRLNLEASTPPVKVILITYIFKNILACFVHQ